MEPINIRGTMLLKASTEFVVADYRSLFVASQHTVLSAAERVMKSRSMRAANVNGEKFTVYSVAQWQSICAAQGIKVRVG